MSFSSYLSNAVHLLIVWRRYVSLLYHRFWWHDCRTCSSTRGASVAAYQLRVYLINVSILEGFRPSNNFSRFCPRLSVKPLPSRAQFFLFTPTFSDRIDALGETADTFQFDVPESLVFYNLVKILQSTAQLVVFFAGHLGCSFSSWYVERRVTFLHLFSVTSLLVSLLWWARPNLVFHCGTFIVFLLTNWGTMGHRHD